MGDFVVDTKGHCFLCLRQIPTISHRFNLKGDKELHPEATSSIPQIHSLQYFSRYLKMDMGKMFSTNMPVSLDLLARVENAKLKAVLCEECAFMTERLSELYRQLEKIEIEMAFYVSEIHQTLVTAETNQLSKSIESDFAGKMEIVNALRNEAANKCCGKLDEGIAPRVKVQKQTVCQLNDKRLKIKSCSRTKTYSFSLDPVDPLDPMIEANVKLEPGCATTSMSIEDCNVNDMDFNECDSLEDSKIDLDKSSILSASTDVHRKTPTNAKLLNKLKVPRSKLNPKTGKYKCGICPKEFSRSSDVNRHYRNVHLKIKHKCSLCGKEFSDRDTYIQHHKNVHLHIRYKCSLCGSTFTSRRNYLQHNLTIHMGVRFKCKGCNKTYSQKGHLLDHQRRNKCLQD